MKLVPLTLSSFPVEKAGSASASWKCNAVQVGFQGLSTQIQPLGSNQSMLWYEDLKKDLEEGRKSWKYIDF